MINKNLTEEQIMEITKTAKGLAYEGALENPDYLYSIVETWIDKMAIEDQLETISSDPDILKEMLGFDPETGDEWTGES